MSPADAATNTQCLTHVVTHHGQLTLIPPDNAGRMRKAKPKNRSRTRQERNGRPDEEIRFNTGSPRSTRLPTSIPARGIRRQARAVRQERPREDEYVEDFSTIPDYPPPSFLEAMSTPPLSICPSTTTLVSSPHPSHTPNVPSPSHSHPSPSTVTVLNIDPLPTPQSERPQTDVIVLSNSDSDTDDSSIEIINMDLSQTTLQENLQVVPFRERIKELRKPKRVEVMSPISSTSRHNVSTTNSNGRGRSPNARIVLNDVDETEADARTIAPTPTKRRQLSLSPLRTPLAAKPPGTHELTFSAPPSSSPYSFSRQSSPFFRSTTSLRMPTASFARLPFFPSSPTSSRSEHIISRKLFHSKGKERTHDLPDSEPIDSWEVLESESHPGILSTLEAASELDTEVPSITGVSNSSNETILSSPPVHPLSMRDRKIPPLPVFVGKKTRRAPAPPPISTTPLPDPALPRPPPPIITVRSKIDKPLPPPKKQASVDSNVQSMERLEDLILRKALEVPLPNTPTLEDWTGTAPSNQRLNIQVSYPPSPLSTQPLTPSTPLSNGGLRRHYPGRPLPRPPHITDSTYAAPEGFDSLPRMNSQCPEGLLIDFDDNALVGDVSSTPLPSALTVKENFPLHNILPVASTSSPSPPTTSATQSPVHAEYTDLDALAAHLDESNNDGTDYDALLLLSEFVGPASPARTNTTTVAPTPPHRDGDLLQPASSFLGQVAIDRRRVTKDGRKKLKLTLLGTAIDRCGICLSQSKEGGSARPIASCQHSFHQKCLETWLMRSRTCPTCRSRLDEATT